MPRYTGTRPIYSGRVDRSIVVTERASDTPIQVVEAFSSAMNGLFPTLPGTISELRDALGGTNKAAALITLPGNRNKDGSQRIGISPRALQRYIAAEEHRAVSSKHSIRRADIAARGEVIRQLQNAVAPKLRIGMEAKMKQDGVVMTMLGSLRVAAGGSKNYTEGRFIHWKLDGPAWEKILKSWNAGKKTQAARQWNRAFARSYALPAARWSYLNELTFEPPS